MVNPVWAWYNGRTAWQKWLLAIPVALVAALVALVYVMGRERQDSVTEELISHLDEQADADIAAAERKQTEITKKIVRERNERHEINERIDELKQKTKEKQREILNNDDANSIFDEYDRMARGGE